MPFALLLDDGAQCYMRNGGAWGSRDDGLAGAYGCNGESVVLAPYGTYRVGTDIVPGTYRSLGRSEQ
jgi:hypothetical protein